MSWDWGSRGGGGGGGAPSAVTTDLPAALRTAAAGFSVARRLTPDYTGPLIRVLRDADDEGLDIYPNADGTLNEALLLNFMGSDTGWITTYYDQLGSSDATNTTKSQMHKIVDAGAVIKLESKPAALGSATSGGYAIAGAGGITRAKSHLYALSLVKPADSANNHIVFRATVNGASTSSRFAQTITSSEQPRTVGREADAGAGALATLSGNYTDTFIQVTSRMEVGASVLDVRVNAGTQTENDNGEFTGSTTDDADNGVVTLWGGVGADSPLVGNCVEMLIYNTELSANALLSCENNQVNYFLESV